MKRYALLLLALLLLSTPVACSGTLEVGVEKTPTPTPLATEPAQIEISVYFTDSNRYATGTPPFEVSVTRSVPPTSKLP